MTVALRHAKLPVDVSKYSETPLFTADTVPKKLTQEHRTKKGVWGLICVTEGTLAYEVMGTPSEVIHLAAGDTAIVRPDEPHRVTPGSTVTFKVEFYSHT